MMRMSRSFPGRLTLEEWQALPFAERVEQVWRAQSDLLGSFRFCAGKRCRRERSCRGADPGTCRDERWNLKTPESKTKALREEWNRLDRLSEL